MFKIESARGLTSTTQRSPFMSRRFPPRGLSIFIVCPVAGGFRRGVGSGLVPILSGGIFSPGAAWRAMKRDCRVTFVHFHSAPYLPVTSQAKARALAELLTRWQYASRL